MPKLEFKMSKTFFKFYEMDPRRKKSPAEDVHCNYNLFYFSNLLTFKGAVHK